VRAKSKGPTALEMLLRDFGYRVEGNRIISIGIRGFFRNEIFGNCRNVFDAAEILCPVIADPRYTARLIRITCPK
jgi:hypothetical protein